MENLFLHKVSYTGFENDSEGKFLQFGKDADNETVALVLLADGTVREVYFANITFVGIPKEPKEEVTNPSFRDSIAKACQGLPRAR